MNPSASAIERAFECPGSEVLPRVHSHTDDATRGNSIHRYARLRVRGIAHEAAIVHVAPQWRATCERIDWTKLVGGLKDIRSEHAFAIDAQTHEVRFLGEDIGRAYGELGEREFSGTEDIGAIRYDGVPVTADIKTGWEPCTEAEANAQVLFHATRTHLSTGAPRVIGRVAYIRESGSVHIDEHTFTRIDFEDFLDRLDDLVDRIARARRQYAETGTVTVSPGDGKHCRYCPAVHVCPAKVALARALGGDSDAILRELRAMPPEKQGEAWIKAKEIQKLVEMILDGMTDIARQHPVPTRPGKQLAEVSYEKASFVQTKAIELLHQLGATREQVDSVYTIRAVSQVREKNVPGLPKGKRARKGAAA